jgi:hypothetical protein
MTSRALYLFIFFSCLTIVTGFGQVSIKALKLSNIDTNHLYIGVVNILRVDGISNSQIALLSKTCNIERINKNEFNIKAYRIGKDTLTVSKNGKSIFTKIFEVKRIPDPNICLTKLCLTETTINNVLSDPALYVNFPNCLYMYNMTVWRFSGAFIRNNGDTISNFHSATNRFSDDHIKIITSLKKGDKIYFEKGSVGGPDSTPRQFFPFTITIN